METDADAPDGIRIAKVIARAGLCSRREAERWIAEGRVSVDGAPVATPALRVSEASRIAVDGSALAPMKATRLWRYHKPVGLITSHRDPQGRPTVFQSLPTELPRVVSVGRLDLTSEGLLLLTNDGALARLLELPARGWVRRYRARVFGAVDEKALAALRMGIKTVVVPRQSMREVEEIPRELRRKLEFIPVEEMADILDIALTEKRDWRERTFAPSSSPTTAMQASFRPDR